MKNELRKLSWWLPLLRWCPVGAPGKARLGRWLLRRVLHKCNVMVQTQRGENFLLPSLAESIGFHPLREILTTGFTALAAQKSVERQ